MTRKGPLITLIGGLCLALILLAISVNAASKDRDRRGRGDTALQSPEPDPSAAPSGEPSEEPSPSPTAAIPARGTYAARVSGASGTVAIAIRDGKAIAYVCDGHRIEAWLQGTAVDGVLSLSGTPSGHLSGNLASGRISGSFVIEGKRWSFIAPRATPPGGLYRAAATVNNARVNGGWIVLPDGSQVGVVSVNEAKAPAPRLDTDSRSATISGHRVTATSIDGKSGSGF